MCDRIIEKGEISLLVYFNERYITMDMVFKLIDSKHIPLKFFTKINLDNTAEIYRAILINAHKLSWEELCDKLYSKI